jgi:ribosomal protein L32
MRHTSSHTKNRRSHHALVATNLVTDKESGALRLPHRLDETTGMYRGKQIVPQKTMKIAENKQVRRMEAKHEHVHNEGGKEPMHSIKEDKTEKSTGLMGRMTKGKAKARSGMGGQAG